ncbi:diacylglycerol/lipid kinase family protein [Croceicoccus ponticola]|nr:diacylglycerol kinase family protein [Croceicoccus ponticola]
MANAQKTWLVINPDSGSYDAKAFDALCASFAEHAIELDRVVQFPSEDLPTIAQLDAADVDLVTIYTGDGTINALVTALYGWGGSILILPGGTMNLLSIRLHGDVDSDTIVARVAEGQFRSLRPSVVRCEAGDALAGLMVGPGTAWGDVREAMRKFDVLGVASGAATAIGQSTAGVKVRVVEPEIGEPDGYPLIVMTPEQGNISVAAYHSTTVAEYAQQGVALLKRDFREGPHDDLGTFETMTLASADSEPLQILIDGEGATLDPRARFWVAPCEVDIIVTVREDEGVQADAGTGDHA